MRQIFHWIIAAIVVVLLLGPGARADQSAAKKKTAAQKTAAAAPKSQKEQKLNPIVVTATKIEQPLAEIGTTVTVVENGQVEAHKIDRVENVLRELPGVQGTQSGSAGSVTEVA